MEHEDRAARLDDEPINGTRLVHTQINGTIKQVHCPSAVSFSTIWTNLRDWACCLAPVLNCRIRFRHGKHGTGNSEYYQLVTLLWMFVWLEMLAHPGRGVTVRSCLAGRLQDGLSTVPSQVILGLLAWIKMIAKKYLSLLTISLRGEEIMGNWF